MSDNYWRGPVKWNRDAQAAGVRARVFCASMADVFEDHPDVGVHRDRLWPLIETTPWLDWQLLTKRPENVAAMVPWSGTWPTNVWIGTSVETQRFADQRIPVLLALTGAAVRFLSCEPLLGPLDLAGYLPRPADAPWFPLECRHGYDHCPICDRTLAPQDAIAWVISGGESGPKARPSHPDWFRGLRDQCVAAGVPHLFKQWGEWSPVRALGQQGRARFIGPSGERFNERHPQDMDPTWATVYRVGKKLAGRELDGRSWDQYPQVAGAVTA
jgi:protein gp37